MCIEFFLALLYLIIILIINYFLIKLVVSYQKSILLLVKLNTIVQNFDIKQINQINFFYQLSKKEKKIENFVSELQNFSKTKDILIIGNICKLILNSEKITESSILYYFQLLERQYLSN